MNPCNAARLQIATNYTIFLHEIRKDTIKAINLLKVTQELALTLIDDSADALKDFTQEEYGLMDSIKVNLHIFT